MAAHATLWNERHPERKIHSCHIIYLPKDGSTPKHHAYANYETQWREFACLLAAFAAKNGTPKPVEVTRDPELVAELARLKAELQASAAAEAGKTLRAFAPPPPPRKHVGKGTTLAGGRVPASMSSVSCVPLPTCLRGGGGGANARNVLPASAAAEACSSALRRASSATSSGSRVTSTGLGVPFLAANAASRHANSRHCVS